MSIFGVIRGRIIDVLVNGRGADGSLGVTAQSRSIPAGRFRTPADNVSPRDANAEGPAFDRSVFLEWESVEDADQTSNPVDGPQMRYATVRVLVGYMGAGALTDFLHPINAGEAAATSLEEVRERALSDAERIKRALADPDLIRGGTALDPAVIACTRAGASSMEYLGGGRFLCSTTYRVVFMEDNAQTYDPTAPP